MLAINQNSASSRLKTNGAFLQHDDDDYDDDDEGVECTIIKL